MEESFCFLADLSCVEYGLVMEIKYNLQRAVCCDTPISFDSFESAIQI